MDNRRRSFKQRAGTQMAAVLLVLAWSRPGAATPLPAAIFTFELYDTSLEGEMTGARPDEQARLRRLDQQLRDLLGRSGAYAPVDMMPVEAAARAESLRSCGGCETALAQKVGAEVAVTGWVQKVSNLILNINVVIRDATTGQTLRAGSVDIRGNTDESWSRGLSYLVRNRLFVPTPDPRAGTAADAVQGQAR
jgi:Protein of unknown function (DUF2380)